MSRRGENIYKRKDGRWEARYLYAKDLNGKPKYKYLYAKTYREAKVKLHDLIVEPNKIISNIANSNSVKQICDIWLCEVKSELKPSSYVKYRNIVNNHISPHLGNYTMQFLDTATVREFTKEKLISGKINGGGLSPKTVKDILSVLRLVVAFASNMGIYTNINFDAINIRANDANIKVLTKSQCNKLSAYLINHMSYTNLGVLLCLYTGIRIGEICALKFEDISLSDKVVHIGKTMQRIQNFNISDTKKTNVIITLPKSKKSVRDIPIPNFIIKIIKKNFSCSSRAFLLSGNLNFVEPRTLENRFNAILRKCGIENTNFHSLRHTFATHSIEVGFETKSLSEILGHSSVNITLNRYVHSTMELKRRNMEKINFASSKL